MGVPYMDPMGMRAVSEEKDGFCFLHIVSESIFHSWSCM